MAKRIAESFLSFWSSRASIEFSFRYPGILPYRNMRICLILIFFSPFFPHTTTEDTRGNRKCLTILLSPPPVSKENLLHFPSTCFQIWKRVAPFACIGGKRKERLFPSSKKTAWFSRTILIVFKEILAVSDLYFCAESVFDRFNLNLWISEIFDSEPCSPTTRPRQQIEMSKYGRSRKSLKV